MLSTEGLVNLQKVAPTTRRLDPWLVQSPINREAWEKWLRLRGDRLFPARKDISPKELRALLRNVVLVRVLSGGTEFEFRILGDAIVQSGSGIETGMTTAALDRKVPGYGKTLHSIYTALCAKRAPRAYHGYLERNDGKAFVHESLMLPLGATDAAVDHILIIGIYARVPL